mmetsp:Transcript_4443/g.14031  ORF Transcript_4443/g.14031 Transcript_4443/m.14031 type:complete len:262 (+) Transcript_4443:423-1208(+)
MSRNFFTAAVAAGCGLGGGRIAVSPSVGGFGAANSKGTSSQVSDASTFETMVKMWSSGLSAVNAESQGALSNCNSSAARSWGTSIFFDCRTCVAAASKSFCRFSYSSTPPWSSGRACCGADSDVRVAERNQHVPPSRSAACAVHAASAAEPSASASSGHATMSSATRLRVRTKPTSWRATPSSAGARTAPTMVTSTHSGRGAFAGRGLTSFIASSFPKSPMRSVDPTSSRMAMLFTAARRKRTSAMATRAYAAGGCWRLWA